MLCSPFESKVLQDVTEDIKLGILTEQEIDRDEWECLGWVSIMNFILMVYQECWVLFLLQGPNMLLGWKPNMTKQKSGVHIRMIVNMHKVCTYTMTTLDHYCLVVWILEDQVTAGMILSQMISLTSWCTFNQGMIQLTRSTTHSSRS